MSERIMTLFGEEIVPEQPKPVAKSRTKKKANEELPDEVLQVANEPVGNDDQDAIGEPVNADDNKVDEGPMLPFPLADEAAPFEIVAGLGTATIPDALSAADPVEIDTTGIAEASDTMPAVEATISSAKKQRARPNEENIILPEDWHGDKKYYSIGEVAELFKVKTSHIRFWTNEFKIKVRTTRKGDRLFTPEQIRELRAIHHLVKERGFTLTGAKGKLKEQNNRDVETVDLKTSLLQLRNKLVIIKNQLT